MLCHAQAVALKQASVTQTVVITSWFVAAAVFLCFFLSVAGMRFIVNLGRASTVKFPGAKLPQGKAGRGLQPQQAARTMADATP